jgi:hypothetical protein
MNAVRKRLNPIDRFDREWFAETRTKIARKVWLARILARSPIARSTSPYMIGRYAFVHPSTSRPGGWRITHFDARGFSGHHEFPTKRACYLELAGDRFAPAPASVLDELSSTEEWRVGTLACVYTRMWNETRAYPVKRAMDVYLEAHGLSDETIAEIRVLVSTGIINAMCERD